METKLVGVDKIRQFKNTPCQDSNSEFIVELENSIKETGLQVPLIVKKVDETSFEIIDGNKRLVACRKLEYKEVPVVIREVKDEREQIILSLVTNLQRHTLTPLEIANSIKHLMDLEMSQHEIAKKIGKSQGWVQVRYSLLQLDPETLKLAGPETPADQRLSQSKAYMLVGLPPSDQVNLAKTISDPKISTADARRIVSREVKEKNIPTRTRNTSRLCLLEDIKQVKGFIKRTNEYLDNFLGTDNKKFQDIFYGETLDRMKALQIATEEAASSMSQLSECFRNICDSKVSKSKDLDESSAFSEKIDETDDRDKTPVVNEIDPEKSGTTQLLLYVGVPYHEIYPKQNWKGGKKNPFWKRKIDHLGILEKARNHYMTRIKEIHPDVCNETTEDVAMLNCAWDAIKHRFELHGFKLNQ